MTTETLRERIENICYRKHEDGNFNGCCFESKTTQQLLINLIRQEKIAIINKMVSLIIEMAEDCEGTQPSAKYIEGIVSERRDYLINQIKEGK